MIAGRWCHQAGYGRRSGAVGGGHKETGDRYLEGGTTGEAGKRMAA